MPKRPPPAPSSSFSYDEKSGRYRRRSTGQYVPQSAVREAIDVAIEREQRELTRISRRLRAGTISLDQWQVQMAETSKSLHLWSGTAARGGWGQMTSSDYGKIGARVRAQYGYLDNFAQQIERGEVNVKLGGFLTRVEMYADAGRNTYHSILLSVMMDDVGMTEERNVLGIADHCDGCLEAEAEGWVPIDTLPLPGERDCLTRCKCDIIYR